MATLIHNVTELQAMSADLTADYELANDIDASATATWNWDAGRGVYSGFVPIGSWQTSLYFSGHFDGKGHTITGLYENRKRSSPENYRDGGLFGFALGATIQNVILVNANITGRAAGSLGDSVQDTNVSNCHSINGIINGASWRAGGLIEAFWGENITPLMSGCDASGTVSTMLGSDEAGGLCAYLYQVNIETSYSTCTVESSREGGGFAVHMWGISTVDQCFATGDVTSYSDAAGFIPHVGGTPTISNSYARGKIHSTDSLAYGFCGSASGITLTLINCYSTGEVISDEPYPDYEYGFAEASYNGINNITACFYDKQTSTIDPPASDEVGIPKTTAQMKAKATFSGWDFSSIWSITGFCNNGYPCLQDVTPNCSLIPSIQGPQVREIIALEAMRNIEMGCMGRLYVDEEGNLTYESRYARNP